MNDTVLQIMILDDDDHVCMNLSAFLEDEGFIVHEATTAENALRILTTETIDAGIIDVRLPGIDGNMLILQAHEQQPEMKFVIYTGSADYTLPRELFEIGIGPQQVFMKPLKDMSMLVQAIKSLTGRKGKLS